jgi:DNA repair exonuclease SbcCD ATPase subunit
VRITRLVLRDIRRYRDQEIELAPGLTIVRGPNEAGKSTIQRAIELALTRKVTSSAADLDALVPWDGEPEARTSVALAFTWEDDEGVTREGRLEKSFRGARGTVRLDYDGQVVTDPARADELLAELSGVPTEAFFRSTASVRHHELAGLQRDEAALRDRLQASISGADRGTSRARKKLERALHELQTRGAKNPGRLKIAEDAVTETATRLEAGEAALQRLEHDRDALAAARERRADAERALVERTSLLEKARQAERLIADRAVARERYERFREAVGTLDDIAGLETTHPSAMPLSVIRPAVDRLRALDAQIATLRAMLTDEVQVAFEVPPEVKWRPLSRGSLLVVALGLLVAGGAFGLEVAGILGVDAFRWQLGGAAIAVVGLVLAMTAFLLRRRDRMHYELRDVEIHRRLRGRSQLEAELQQAEAETLDLLERIGQIDLAGAEDLVRREDEHVARIAQLRARLEGLVGKEPPESLPQRRDAAALEIEQKAAALDALGPIAKEPRARERLEVEVADQGRALERARDDEATARARVEQNAIDAEEVAGLAERLAMWQDELAALKRRERVYATTLREITAAEQATMQRATRYLERRMVRDIERITDGRYRRVRVDDTNLGIELFSPERSDWVSASNLSQGTLDIVYLAARLGLVRLVTGDRRPPLVLDDPFVSLDDQRATRALALLRELVADFQVVYLTTSPRYDAVADLVVELPGPTAVDLTTTLEPEGAVHA